MLFGILRHTTTGVEGFFGLTTPNLALNSNPGKEATIGTVGYREGTDFVRFHNLLGITISHVDKE